MKNQPQAKNILVLSLIRNLPAPTRPPGVPPTLRDGGDTGTRPDPHPTRTTSMNYWDTFCPLWALESTDRIIMH